MGDFIQKAVELLTGVFNELLDWREQHCLAIWHPVAAGAPAAEGEASPPREARPKRKRQRSPARSPREDKKVKKERSRRRERKASPNSQSPHRKPKSEESHSRSRHPKSRRSPTPRPSRKKVPVKEEPTDKDRDRPHTPTVKGEASPVRSSTRSRGEEPVLDPQQKGVHGPHSRPERIQPHLEEDTRERGSDLPPGTWTLRERPPAPRTPPRSSRPPEPPGPPPGWVPRRSKGVTRRERNNDIYQFGPSSSRKQLRLDRRL